MRITETEEGMIKMSKNEDVEEKTTMIIMK